MLWIDHPGGFTVTRAQTKIMLIQAAGQLGTEFVKALPLDQTGCGCNEVAEFPGILPLHGILQ
jgi:hypothetical protein